MTKLNQIIAIANGKKANATVAITEIYKTLQKPQLFAGFERKYQSLDDEGEVLPSESNRVQETVADNIRRATDAIHELLDIIATQEYNNCNAKADVVVDGEVLLKDVPVTYMLFLEKQLDNIKSLVSKLPTLSSDVRWRKSDSDEHLYVTDTVTTVRTKKVPKAFVKYEATKEHPAQVEVFTEDVQVGTWNKVDMSGSIPVTQRDEMLKRVEKLREAVKSAREAANSINAENVVVGKNITDYIFV